MEPFALDPMLVVLDRKFAAGTASDKNLVKLIAERAFLRRDCPQCREDLLDMFLSPKTFNDWW